MAIDPALIKWYRCATWTEDDTHGGDIDTAKADGNALSIGNLAQNEYQAIWIRRTVDASALGYTNLQFVISAESS